MNYLKKAKSAMKDVQDLHKGFKDLGILPDKSKNQSIPASGIAAPSVVAHSTTSQSVTASNTASPIVAAPSSAASEGTAPSALVQAENLAVPPNTAEGAPVKVPLAARKRIRDDFENRKPELEQELSSILGTEWKIHVDTAGVYTYMANEGSPAFNNPGVFITEYFTGAIHRLKIFMEQYGQPFISQINSSAPSHLLTLEPTADTSVEFNTTDFHASRWRLLFRSTASFGTNTYDALESLPNVVNTASKNLAAGGHAPNALSIDAQNSITKGYEPAVPAVLSSARAALASPRLTFTPNFQENYNTLFGFAESNPSEIRNDWEIILGKATLTYFEGFVSQLSWQKFDGDDMMQEGFRDVIDHLEVKLVVTDQTKKNHNDCVVEGGVLIMRVKPASWWVNCNEACEGLSDLL